MCSEDSGNIKFDDDVVPVKLLEVLYLIIMCMFYNMELNMLEYAGIHSNLTWALDTLPYTSIIATIH